MINAKAGRIENGIEICNTYVRPANDPFRYKLSGGRQRGCVSTCHDAHVRRNMRPGWAKPRFVLPKWITEARHAIKEASNAR